MCMNNLRQISLATKLYAGDNADYLPPRTNQYRWPAVMKESYQKWNCWCVPTDAKRVPADRYRRGESGGSVTRGYLINGWNDYFKANLAAPAFTVYMAGVLRKSVHQGVGGPQILRHRRVWNLEPHGCFGSADRDRLLHGPAEGLGNDADRVERGVTDTAVGNKHQVRRFQLRFRWMAVRGRSKFRDVWPENIWAVSNDDRRRFRFSRA